MFFLDYNGRMTLSAFIAGFLMFLAPCTLPLVPAYLAFISGVDPADLKSAKNKRALRRKVMWNGFLYVLGFTVVFVVMGVAAAFLGTKVLAEYRFILTKVGGIFVIVFGLFMLDVLKIPELQKTHRLVGAFKKGSPLSSFLLGASFAFGWVPCIGPILASILLVAATSTTALQGAVLLFVFSMGMGIPFLIIAWGIGSAYENVKRISKYMPVISKVGGVFLIILGVLLFTNQMGLLVRYGYEWFDFLNYDNLLDYY